MTPTETIRQHAAIYRGTASNSPSDGQRRINIGLELGHYTEIKKRKMRQVPTAAVEFYDQWKKLWTARCSGC